MAVVAGLVDYRDSWAEFCKDWQTVLNKYSAPYFHFCELSTASLIVRGKIKANRDFLKNPYSKWPLKKIDSFLYELAAIVGSGNKVIVGGWIETANIHQHQKKNLIPPHLMCIADKPYLWALRSFFENLPNDILSGWPDWKEPVSIFFDLSANDEWRQAATAFHGFYRKKDSRFEELAFADKKIPPHLPWG